MFTWQDFINYNGTISDAIKRAINENRASALVKNALTADLYDAQKNKTITNFVKMLYTRNGRVPDEFSSNHRICSNFFQHLNTQRMAYSLGNGVTFSGDGVKEKLGSDFDTKLRTAGYYSLIHGVSFVFWNLDHVHVFPITEFAPLWDEETGALMGGIRYWQIDYSKPLQAVLYEVDGYTRFRANREGSEFVVQEEKRAYRLTTAKAPIQAEAEIVGEENYSALPIIPLYGSRLHQSTIVGMQGSIDAYDLIRSGFANDLSDCSEIYWIVSNAGGMDDADLAKFRKRLKVDHIANLADAEDVSVTPYTQEIPFNARKTFLDDIRSGIYEDFGGLDVHTVAAGATNDHIEAAYQPLDDNADDFEYQIIDAVQHLLQLIGIEDTPEFKRNRISNEAERTNMILAASNYLDDETVLNLLPFITPDMVREIMERKGIEDLERFNSGNNDDIGEDDVIEAE